MSEYKLTGPDIACSVDSVGQISDGYHTFDELYDHRCTLFVALMQQMPTLSWFSTKHGDGTEWEGWFICGITLSSGNVTYHLPNEMMELVGKTGAKQLDYALPWDGHSSDDVITRLQEFISKDGSPF